MDTYHQANKDQASQALREIMQEIALAGLERSCFFEKAAFYEELSSMDGQQTDNSYITAYANTQSDAC